jgi:ABC-type polar amino acid transport system ATPase subunit
MQPRMILFDEPASALDPELVAGILETTRGLADRGMTVAVVTHEMGLARKLADVVHFVSGGRILGHGPARTELRCAAKPAPCGHPPGL